MGMMAQNDHKVKMYEVNRLQTPSDGKPHLSPYLWWAKNTVDVKEETTANHIPINIQENKLSFQKMYTYTVNPAHEVTSIKQSPIFKGHLFVSCCRKIHLSYKAMFSLSQRWPLSIGLTLFWVNEIRGGQWTTAGMWFFWGTLSNTSIHDVIFQ
jgi:hypothetical protein